MNNPLGISINAANCDLMNEYAAAGFRVAEISPRDQPFEGLRAFCEQAAEKVVKSGMKVWSVHLPFSRALDLSQLDPKGREQAVAHQCRVIELAGSLGAQTLVVHGSAEPNEDSERAARLAASAESLEILNRAAGEMRLAVENLPRTCIGRVAEEAVALAGHCAGLCFDVNHLLMQSHADFLQLAAPKVITTHLSDYDGVDERHWLPGMGVVPFRLVRDRLLEAGYTGPFLFELRTPEDGPYKPGAVVAAWEKAIG